MELNEAELIEREIKIRNLRLTKEVLETRRSIARWLALSLGVINPGESRQSAVAVLDAMLNFQFAKNVDPGYEEIAKYIAENWEEMNEKTLRYHLLRMKKIGLIEHGKGKFYFKPPSMGEKYDINVWAANLFEDDYKQIAKNVGEAIKELKNKQQ